MGIIGNLLRIVGLVWIIFAVLRLVAAMTGAIESEQAIYAILGALLGWGALVFGASLKGEPVANGQPPAPPLVESGVSAPSDPSNTRTEQLWASALAEAEGNTRRAGLWARSFAEASGSDAAAKALYTKARFNELSLEAKREVAVQATEARLASLTPAQRAEALIPKGKCPSCKRTIPLASTECPICDAVFGPQSAWKVAPLRET
jgi:hypothetical protein